MAIGTVNVPGSVGTDLADVRNTANEAFEKASNNEIEIAKIKDVSDEALSTALEAKNIANDALSASNNAQVAADAALKATTKLTNVINALPTQNGTLTYNGEELSPKWNSYDDTKLTIGGDISATNAGTYTATFTPKNGYMWNDETVEAKSVNWTINRASITVPSQNGSLAYTGSTQSPTWNNYDSNKMTISGTTSGVNASNYTAIFTPKDNYQWIDGTISDKIVTWSIGKTAGSLSLSKTSVTLNVSALTATVTVTRTGNGAITATSGNTSIATVSVSGTTLTITAKAKGTVTITVSVAATTDYTAPTSKTINVTVDLPSTILNECTPEEIQKIVKSGEGPNYWDVGDRIGIKLNGKVGELTFNNETYYAFIIGFNHNSAIEGSNTIHFQFGKDSEVTDMAFCDKNYNRTSTTGFIMNTTKNNKGGWNGSYMRKTICPAFLDAMPSEWQNVIAPCTKYSDNSGGGNNTESFVTATSDRIWLLSEFEAHGARDYANSGEKRYQKQYDYYRNGNRKIRHHHLEKGTACNWWLRSVGALYDNEFCIATIGDVTVSVTVDVSLGFAPCFMIA